MVSTFVTVAAAAALGVNGICAGIGTGPEGAVLVWDGQRTSAASESAQFTLGHGPSQDVLTGGVAALVSDLARETARWPKFGLVAVDRKTQVRSIKPSAHFLGAMAREHDDRKNAF